MSLEDRFAILEAIATFSYTCDSDDVDGWVNVFTDDGVWESRRRGEPEPRTRRVGSAALHEFAANLFSSRGDRDISQARHYQTNTVFLDLTAETARTRTMALITWLMSGEMIANIAWTGVYIDDWRKTEGGWKISRRELYLDQPP
jgi:3-phenylpropionate/cinnamic acid dioxygenase small subunit